MVRLVTEEYLPSQLVKKKGEGSACIEGAKCFQRSGFRTPTFDLYGIHLLKLFAKFHYSQAKFYTCKRDF